MKYAVGLQDILEEAGTAVLPADGAATAPSEVLAADTGTGRRKPEPGKWVSAE